jgi:acetyl esterase/lipase
MNSGSERAPAPGEPMGSLPGTMRREMARIGPIWGSDIQKHREIVLAAYAPLLAQAPKAGIAVERDIAYGEHPRQVLDVYRGQARQPAPVVIFAHGGAFVRGSKTVNDEVYANVLYYFARNGCVGINMEYRLAPEATFPAGADDVAGAVRWARAHAAEHGGDPARVFVVGHSAGGAHVASFACDPNLGRTPAEGAAGVVLLSGRLRADARPENPNAEGVRAYYGDDGSTYEARSPVTWAQYCPVPVMLAIAEFDNPLLDVYGAEFFWRIAAARGAAPRFVRLRNHNHFSMFAHFNTGEEILGREILDFIAALR